jgi:peptidoglycan hydrolase-like protein with peptidoglycan-binding domain
VKTLQRGDKGEEVARLQGLLFQLDCLKPQNVTGEFDNDTEQGVKKFQHKRGLTISGVVKADDWEEIEKAMKEIR